MTLHGFASPLIITRVARVARPPRPIGLAVPGALRVVAITAGLLTAVTASAQGDAPLQATAPSDPGAGPGERRRLALSGANDCRDLPAPPAGVPGLREYARVTIHHDGVLEVTAAQLPFANNPGYLYRLVKDVWEPNELDYILLRSPMPVRGGFTYVVAFGGDEDRCGPWSLDMTYPQ